MKHPELKKHLTNKMNGFFTEGLFWENRHNGNERNPIYTFKGEDIHTADGRVMYSAKKIYLECMDITEYKAAMALLGDWDHWKRLLNNKQIRSFIDAWREELEVKLISQGLSTIVVASLEESNTGLSAAKFLAKREWKDGTDKKRGRPSKEEVAKERRIQAAVTKKTEDDALRIGLKLN